MSKREPLETTDYLIDEAARGENENRLLNWDDMPAEHLRVGSHIALAELAAWVQKHARTLNGEQLEQGVRWLKKWKLQDRGWRGIEQLKEGELHFWQVLDALRNSPQQARQQRQGFFKFAFAGAAGMAFVFAAIGAIAMIVQGGVAVGWKIGEVAFAFVLFAIAGKLLRQGINIFKEQDRRYALESIRAAVNVPELIESGLFAYIPTAMLEESKKYDEIAARKAFRKARECLVDALYTDHDGYLDIWQLSEQAQGSVRFATQPD